MRIPRLSALVAFVAATMIVANASLGQTVHEVRQALLELNQWVESDKERGIDLWNGTDTILGWRESLNAVELGQSLLLYPQGDRKVLEHALNRLKEDQPVYKLPQPTRLRQALEGLLAPHNDAEMKRIEGGLREMLDREIKTDPERILNKAKSDVRKAMEEVESVATRWPEQYRAGWKEYLRWKLLEEEIAADHIPTALRLRKIRRLMDRNHNGLELPAMRELENAIRRLVDATAFYDLHYPRVFSDGKNGDSDDRGFGFRRGSRDDEEEDAVDPASEAEEMPEGESEEGMDEPEPLPAAKKAESDVARGNVEPRVVYRRIVQSLIQRVSDGGRRGDGRQNGELNFDLAMAYKYPVLRQLVKDIRKHLSQPSLHVYVTEAFVNELGSLPIDQSMNVQETIMGARMTGTSRAVGRTSVNLTYDPYRVSADYLLNSKVYSQNTGNRGKIVAQSTSTADVTGVIKAHFDLTTGLLVEPAAISADTHTNIDSVQANTRIFRRLISRIATRAANKQLPQAQYEASRKTEQRISGEFNKQASERVQRINQTINEKVTPFLTRRGDIKGLHFSSSEIAAQGSGRLADMWQVSANGPPPSHGLTGPVIVQVHESLVNNWLESEMADNIMQIRGMSSEWSEYLGLQGPDREPCPGDKELDEAEAKEREKAEEERKKKEEEKKEKAEKASKKTESDSSDENGGDEEAGEEETSEEESSADEEPDSGEEEEEEAPAPGALPRNSLQLALKAPIALSFEKDAVRVQAVINRLTGDELKKSSLNEPMEISAFYKLNRTGGDFVLDRDGTVQVNFFDLDKNQLSVMSSKSSIHPTAKALLTKRISHKVLRCRFNVTKIVDRLLDRVVGQNATFARLREYQVTAIKLQDGWLSVSLDRRNNAGMVVGPPAGVVNGPVVYGPASGVPVVYGPVVSGPVMSAPVVYPVQSYQSVPGHR